MYEQERERTNETSKQTDGDVDRESERDRERSSRLSRTELRNVPPAPVDEADPAAIVGRERAAGKGDSEAAVAALRAMVSPVNDGGACLALARAESRIVLGAVQQPLHFHFWAAQLRALPAATRGRQGYERLLQVDGSKKTFDRCIEELLAMKDESSAVEVALDVIRAFRAAGLGADFRVVDEIVMLHQRYSFSFARIESMLGGQTFEDDEALLAKLQETNPVAHAAYLQAEGRIAKPKTERTTRRTTSTTTTRTTTTETTTPVERTAASGGGTGERGGLMGPYALGAAGFEGVADEDMNVRMAELLLRAAGAEPQLAAWLARYTGPVPPTKLYGITPDLPDTYGQFRIWADGNKEVMRGADIRAYITKHGYIDPTLDATFWTANVAPLLCNENVVAASQAELMAQSYDKQIAELQKLIGDRATSPYIDEVKKLQATAQAYRELAMKLQTKQTTMAEQRELMKKDVIAIDRMLGDARAELATADKQVATEQPTNLVDDYAQWQRTNPNVPYRPPVQSQASQASAQARSRIMDLEERKRITELVLSTPGMVMPGAGDMDKERPGPSVSAATVTPATTSVRTIENLTTTDPFATGPAATVNRALVALLHLKGRVDSFGAGVTRLIGDLSAYILPDSMTAPILGLSKQMAESANAFTNAQTAVTSEDAYVRLQADRTGWKIPVLDRTFTLSRLIEAPDQVLFTVIGAIPVAKGPGLAIQGGIVGFQTMEAFFRTYGAGGSVSQSIKAAGLTAIEGAAATLMSAFKLPVAVAGNLALVYMFGKLQGLSNEQIEEQIVLTLVTVGVTVGAARAASQPKLANMRERSTQALEAMRKADKTAPLEEVAPREADPVRDAQIDVASNKYRDSLSELQTVSAKLEQARKVQSREDVTTLTKQMGAISEKAKQAREALQALIRPTTAEVVTRGETTNPRMKDGFQVDDKGERLEGPNEWFLDGKGNEVNGKGQRVDADGMVLRLDDKGQPIPNQYLDGDGRAIDRQGRYIDETGKPLTQAEIDARYGALDLPNGGALADGTPLALTGKDLNQGSGGTSHIWEATINGTRVVVKTPKGKPDPAIAQLELAAAKQLEGLGGPRVLGTATFQQGGKTYTGVVLELVPGIDLARVLAGAEPPFAITREHLRALEGFRDVTSNAKLKLYDVNPGDFILTEDGRVVPIDIAFETRGKRTTNPDLDRTIDRFRDFLGGTTRLESPIPKPTEPLSPPPPEMADLVTNGIAKRGEAWGNNINEGSCAHVAMRNAISAKLAGRETYVFSLTGLTELGQMLKRFRLDPDGRIGQALTKLGKPTRGGHAVAAIKGEDGVWRYVSWGHVELDWKTYTQQIWGSTGEVHRVFETDQYVQWMFDNPRLHVEPRGTSPTLERVSREAREQRELEEAAKSETADLGWIAQNP